MTPIWPVTSTACAPKFLRIIRRSPKDLGLSKEEVAAAEAAKAEEASLEDQDASKRRKERRSRSG